MLARVAGQGAVVRLEVERVLPDEAVVLEEAEGRLRVEVVLMGHRLARLGLEEELACEADLLLVLGEGAEEVRVVGILLRVPARLRAGLRATSGRTCASVE